MIKDRYTLFGVAARYVERHRGMDYQPRTNTALRNGHRNRLTFYPTSNTHPSIFMCNFKGVLLAVLCLLVMQPSYADVGSSMRKGNHLFRKEDYEGALKSYQEALIQEPDNPEIHYNIARALFKMEQYDEAIGEFQMGLLEKDRNFQANVLYNIGNCHFKKGQLDAAIDDYKNSLLLNHKDVQTKQNLELCLKIKEQMQNQPQSDSTGTDQQQDQDQEKEQPQPQPRKPEMSQEEAERILQALQNKEQQNMEKAKEQEREEHVDKDW